MHNSVRQFDYFIYNGIAYAKGTEMKLIDAAYEKYGSMLNEKPNAIFVKQDDTQIYCLIKGISVIMIPNDSNYIKEIIKPIYYEKPSAINSAMNNFVTKKKTPDVFDGLLWYIFIFLFLVFCNNGWIYMIIMTIIFIGWLINKYKD